MQSRLSTANSHGKPTDGLPTAEEDLQRLLIDAKMGLAKSEGDRLVDLNELARTREELAGEQADNAELLKERKDLMMQLSDAQRQISKFHETLSKVKKQTAKPEKKLTVAQAIAGSDDTKQKEAVLKHYAAFIGLDPAKDADLLWIAEEGLVAPLPDNWSEHVDHQGNVFYFDHKNKASSWEHPLDSKYRAKVKEAKAKKK